MNEKIKKRWIRALTSGRYKKGTGQLRNGNKFCCLGVLLEVAGVPSVQTKTGHFSYGEGDFSTKKALPEKYQEKFNCQWFGARDENGDSLVDMNDKGRSFLEIADIIERIVKVEEDQQPASE